MRHYAAVKNFKDEEDLLELIWSDFQDKCLSEKCKAHMSATCYSLWKKEHKVIYQWPLIRIMMILYFLHS